MIGELGTFCLALALAVSLAQGIVPLMGASRGHVGWMALARPAAYIHWLLVAISYAMLTYAFITHDYSIAYVANHSNNAQKKRHLQ